MKAEDDDCSSLGFNVSSKTSFSGATGLRDGLRSSAVRRELSVEGLLHRLKMSLLR